MADETRVVRTAGVYGNFVLPGLLETDDGPADLVLHPEGTEITFEQWKTVREAAVANQVVVRLDEDFPGELYAAEIEKAEAARAAEATAGTSGQKPRLRRSVPHVPHHTSSSLSRSSGKVCDRVRCSVPCRS